VPRIFVAIPLPAEIAAEVDRAVPALAGVKRVEPALMHVTLAFVGQVGEERVPDITAAVQVAAGAHGPFDLELSGVGRFPERGRPKIVWAGTGLPAADAIVRLGASVRAELLRHDVRFDPKPLRAHVTIGRVRDGISEPDARGVAAAVAAARFQRDLAFRVTSVHVMESKLSSAGALGSTRGPLYSSRAEVPLLGPPGTMS